MLNTNTCQRNIKLCYGDIYGYEPYIVGCWMTLFTFCKNTTSYHVYTTQKCSDISLWVHYNLMIFTGLFFCVSCYAKSCLFTWGQQVGLTSWVYNMAARCLFRRHSSDQSKYPQLCFERHDVYILQQIHISDWKTTILYNEVFFSYLKRAHFF